MTKGNSDRDVNGNCKCIIGAVNNDGFSCKCDTDYVLDAGVCKPKCGNNTVSPQTWILDGENYKCNCIANTEMEDTKAPYNSCYCNLNSYLNSSSKCTLCTV